MRDHVDQIHLFSRTVPGQKVLHQVLCHGIGISHPDLIDPAVESQTVRHKGSSIRALWHIHGKAGRKVGIGTDAGIERRHMGAGGVSHHKDMVRVKAVFLYVFRLQDPFHDHVDVVHGRRELVLRRQAVGEVHHRKAPFRQVHAVVLVKLLVSVDPAASVHRDDHRKRSFLVRRPVDVQALPFGIGAVKDIQVSYYGIRHRYPCVSSFVALFKGPSDHP